MVEYCYCFRVVESGEECLLRTCKKFDNPDKAQVNQLNILIKWDYIDNSADTNCTDWSVRDVTGTVITLQLLSK